MSVDDERMRDSTVLKLQYLLVLPMKKKLHHPLLWNRNYLFLIWFRFRLSKSFGPVPKPARTKTILGTPFLKQNLSWQNLAFLMLEAIAVG
jgi:hypothetical protein